MVKSQQIGENTRKIKSIAEKLEFQFCGISRAEQLQEEARDLEQWLTDNRHGQMNYMENHFDKRVDPRKLVPDAKSIVSLLYNYYTDDEINGEEDLKISKYAYGSDYHDVIKSKLKEFLQLIKYEIGEVSGRVFVDSAPVMDKVWAKKSGLGWIGKHTNLINKESGSFFFIAELILDLELEVDGPVKDYCGTCTACLDACPTNALYAPYKIDGSKCISYYTIELKEAIPESEKGKFENWIFGCDICQDVCPWNRFSKRHEEKLFEPNDRLKSMNTSDWQELTQEIFSNLFKGSAVKRTKFKGLERNIKFVTESSQKPPE